jgi:uncharacterized membrane protein YbhN (UPF0104 family)
MAATAVAQTRWRFQWNWLWWAFAVLVLVLVWRAAAQVDWPAVLTAVRARPPATLLLIAAAALASHALYGLLDVAGREYAGHGLARWRCWLTATVAYALSLNLGAIVGGVGLRYRMYQQQHVAAGATARVVAASIAANWIGFLLLLATLPWWSTLAALSRWTGRAGAWAIAIGAGVLVLAYLCASWRQPRWHFRGRLVRVPPLRTAVLQAAIATANWAWMGFVLKLALGEVGYDDALAVLLVGAVAGAIAHVPGGWGVLDFVVVTMLSHAVPVPTLVAGVLVYRSAYYLVPLALAAASYVLLTHALPAPKRGARR